MLSRLFMLFSLGNASFPLQVILVFPGPDALTLEEYVAKYSKPRLICDGDSATSTISSTQPVTDANDTKTFCNGELDCGISDSTCQSPVNSTGDGTKPAHTDHVEGRQVLFEKTFDRVVFIDSTWHQVSRIRLDKRLSCKQHCYCSLVQLFPLWRHSKAFG